MIRTRGVLAAVFVTAIFLAALALSPLAQAANEGPVDPKAVEVVDGNTIDVGPDVVRFRLVGFTTPDASPQAKCAAERDKGGQARRRLQSLVAAGGLVLQRVDCSCPRGTQGTKACNNGLFCAVLKAAGRDVAEIMVEAELAEKHTCGRTDCPPLKNWCQ